MKAALALLPALMLTMTILSACGGMNRAVGVLPNTLDDLAQKSAPLRGAPARPDEAR